MMMYLAVLAVQTITFLRAFLPRSITLAVVLSALRFLAGAATHGNEGRNALEGAGVAEVGHLLGLVDLELAANFVAAADAEAFLIAESSLGEALTVHFEAVNFAALAALRGLMAGRQVEAANGA